MARSAALGTERTVALQGGTLVYREFLGSTQPAGAQPRRCAGADCAVRRPGLRAGRRR